MSVNTIVKQGEEVERKTIVEGDVVTKQHVTVHKENDGSETLHKLVWKFDFSKCTKEQILEMASRDAVIKMRPKFKQCPDNEIGQWAQHTFDMAEFFAGTKSKVSNAERAKKAISKLSDAEKEALLKQLQGA